MLTHFCGLTCLLGLQCEVSCFHTPTNSRAREEREAFCSRIYCLDALCGWRKHKPPILGQILLLIDSELIHDIYCISISVGEQQHLDFCPSVPAQPPLPSLSVEDRPATTISLRLRVLSGQVGIGAGTVPPPPSVNSSTVPQAQSIRVSIPV